MADARSPSDRYRQGMATRRRVLGDAHVDRASASATPFDQPFQEMITEGDTVNPVLADSQTAQELAERAAAGKPETGSITLTVAQEGNDIAIDNADDAEPLARVLLASGINTVEITLRTEAALEAVRQQVGEPGFGLEQVNGHETQWPCSARSISARWPGSRSPCRAPAPGRTGCGRPRSVAASGTV